MVVKRAMITLRSSEKRMRITVIITANIVAYRKRAREMIPF